MMLDFIIAIVVTFIICIIIARLQVSKFNKPSMHIVHTLDVDI